MDKNGNGYIHTLNQSLKIFFRDAFKYTIRTPGQALYFLNVVRWQTKAIRRRKRSAKQGLHVPPMIIFSVTNKCNLQCKGCYAQALNRLNNDELSDGDIARILQEAYELGTSFFILAGGEPLVRKQIMDITSRFTDVLFLMFTNGLLLDEKLMTRLKKQKNVIPVLSLEGHQSETDTRRGDGVYAVLKKQVAELKRRNIFFSVSFTVTSNNIQSISDPELIQDLIHSGCRLFFFLEYTPIKTGTDAWIPSEEQRDKFNQTIEKFRKMYPALFVSIPDDEEQFGGCLSSGRGFLHISANGDLEPCPFVPLTDTSLKHHSFKDALRSRLLRVIRDNADQLEEGRGGCTLWNKREWVQSLLEAE